MFWIFGDTSIFVWALIMHWVIKRLLPQTLLSPPFNSFSGYFLRLQSGKSALALFLRVVARTWKGNASLTSSAAEYTYMSCHISEAKWRNWTRKIHLQDQKILAMATNHSKHHSSKGCSSEEMRIKHSILKICYQNLSVPSKNKMCLGTYFGYIHCYPADHWGK